MRITLTTPSIAIYSNCRGRTIEKILKKIGVPAYYQAGKTTFIFKVRDHTFSKYAKFSYEITFILYTRTYMWVSGRRGYLFSTYAKFSKKLTFLNSWYAHVRIPYISVFSSNAGKYEPEKLRIRTLFTQWLLRNDARVLAVWWFYHCHPNLPMLGNNRSSTIIWNDTTVWCLCCLILKNFISSVCL